MEEEYESREEARIRKEIESANRKVQPWQEQLYPGDYFIKYSESARSLCFISSSLKAV